MQIKWKQEELNLRVLITKKKYLFSFSFILYLCDMMDVR